ncbi:RNA 2',3'-cyclic phosphodiesterase [Halomarina rubra]|uniref:RNA 2',3'-cyclic phosphodiesterase n=1 Tax=Halomarina rubra TaxID=2071873 RepID=A0ABD6AW81_9EURY|nr:RNA 2',3'-cyclic phosphodiesterase [Halomarina rubra]
MRAFVSVDCSAASEAIRRAQEPFRGLDGLRLTDPAQAHVTLQFLGDVPDEDAELDTLVTALDGAVASSGVDPFDCTLGGYGTFPGGDYIAVVWLGVEDGAAELTRLATAVERATTDLGFDPDDHAFTPHVTLARMDHAAEKERVQRAVAGTDTGTTALHVDAVQLTESTLTNEGARYESVATFSL